MNQPATWTRRDPRTELPPGTASVEFAWQGPDATPLRVDVVSVSATGISFTLDDDTVAIDEGALLASAIVRYHGSVVRGDLSVRYARPTACGQGREFGCLLYPSSLEDSGHWMLFVKQCPDGDRQPPAHLALRCANCHSVVWIAEAERSSHECPECHQEYGFAKPLTWRILGDLHIKAGGMALELGIDLPSAVSMLLGTLTLTEVLDILDTAPPAEPIATDRAPTRKRHLDPAFQPAIDAGTLTEVNAIQRGSREQFAKRLVERHRIRLSDAYDVADNRASLLSILRQRKAREPIVAKYRPPSSRTRFVAVAGLAVVALVAGVFLVRFFDQEVNHPTAEPQVRRGPVTPRASAAAPTTNLSALPVEAYARVQANERGEVLSVEATDPGNVLVAFCKSNSAGQLDPVDVLPTEPPSDSARLGVVRDLTGEREYRVVLIRRDPQTRRWFLRNAGDPEAGISTLPAPERLVHAARERL